MENIGIIELNAVEARLQILQVEKGGYYNVIEEVNEQIKLGQELETENLIKPSKIKDCIEVLKIYRKVCEQNNTSKIITYATSAFKLAKNQRSFFEEVYNNTSFNFNVLTEEEEIKATYLGVINTVDVQKGIIIDIESLKTNIIGYNRRSILERFSIPYGAFNLADKFVDIVDPLEKWNNIIKFYATELENLEIQYDEETAFIGTGASFVALGKMARKVARYPLDVDNNYVADKNACDAVFDVVKNLDIDKSKKIKGVSEDRADTLASGFAIIKCMMDKLNIQKFSFAPSGFREGMIFSNVVPETNEKPLSDMLGYGLDTVNIFHNIENSNSKHVSELALILFRQLKVLHKLPRMYVKPLRIASAMYDCGKRICYENHSKCSFNVIINSQLNGVSHRDLLLAGFICVCQNLDDFNLADWIKYKDILSDEDLDAARKLGVIVNLASNLDTSKMHSVTDVCCDILGDSLIIKTLVTQNSDFDIAQGMKTAVNFKKVFKRSIQII